MNKSKNIFKFKDVFGLLLAESFILCLGIGLSHPKEWLAWVLASLALLCAFIVWIVLTDIKK
jgi:hypothetical protein